MDTTNLVTSIIEDSKRSRLKDEDDPLDDSKKIKNSYDDDDDDLFWNLPHVIVIQYLEPEDRLALSTSCKFGLQEVEKYCELVLQAITGPDNSKVDDSFLYRIRYVSGYDRQDYPLVFQRKNTGNLPFRLLLERAKSTHLYRFATENHRRAVFQIMSPSQTRLAALTDHGIVKVFDIISKKCVATFDLNLAKNTLGLNDGDIRKWCFLGDDKIIFCTFWGICVGDLLVEDTSSEQQNVRLVYRPHSDAEHVRECWVDDIIPLSSEEIVFVNELEDGWGNFSYEVQVMDVRTESIKSLLKSNRGVFSVAPRLVATTASSTEKFLLIKMITGLHVYNVETMEQTDVWKTKKFLDCTQYALDDTSTGGNNTSTICVLHGRGICDMEVLHLDKNNGKLSLSRVFKVHNHHNNSGEARTMAIADPRVMVEVSWGAAGRNVSLFNLAPQKYHEDDGETIASAERKINCEGGCYSATVSTIHNKWFVGTYNGILAFLHSEPSISSEAPLARNGE